MKSISFMPNALRRLLCLGSNFEGPLSSGAKFLLLDDEYINKFDDIVVIGDVHGCADELQELLDKVHQDTRSRKPSKCLKIIVGDLVNKGPKSSKVLKLCRDVYHDSILAVRGNHDNLVLDLYKSYKENGAKLEAKNKWIEKLPKRHIEYLESLPYSITIPSLKAIIVHAGVDPSLDDPAKDTPLNLMVTMRNIEVLKNDRTGETSYNCTKSIDKGIAWATFWPGPEHIYFGHDARRRLQNEHEFATGLDTGCVYGDRLSYVYIKGLKKGELLSIKARQVYEPVEADDADLADSPARG